MKGVEILSTTEVATEWIFNWKAFWITLAAAFISMFVISIVIYVWDGGLDIAFIPLVTIFCGLFGGLCFGILFGRIVCPTPTKYETQYKVTISDEVPMNEFLEKYEIIDQDGKIYVIQEKES